MKETEQMVERNWREFRNIKQWEGPRMEKSLLCSRTRGTASVANCDCGTKMRQQRFLEDKPHRKKRG